MSVATESVRHCHERRQLYTQCASDTDRPALFRNFVVAARICEDATENGPPPALILDKVDRLSAGCDVLFCIPAYMGSYESRAVAAQWKKHLRTIVLANGCLTKPSIVIHDGSEIVTDLPVRNQIKLCDLNSSGIT